MIVPVTKNTRIYETVYEQMMNIIEEGTWPEGTRIPGEIELAEKFQVSRNSLRMAIKVLHTSEILDVKPGLGTFVTKDAVKKIKHQKLMNFIQEETDFGEVLEARCLLEKETAYLAAERRTDEDIKQLEKISEELELAFKNHEFNKAVDLGCEFHMKIVEITGNHILIGLYASIIDNIKQEKRQKLNETTVDDIYKVNVSRDREIIEAIRDKDGERARKLIEQHIIDKGDIKHRHK